MRWTVHGERGVYTDSWINVRLVDVELPDGRRFDHRAVRVRPSAGAVVLDGRRVLLLWRHRVITDTWGFEIPGGRIETGEPPEQAAAREVEEETGWRPGPLRPLLSVQPSPGASDSRHFVFQADEAVWTGAPADPAEAEQVVWIPLERIPALVDERRIVNGSTMAALLYVLVGETHKISDI